MDTPVLPVLKTPNFFCGVSRTPCRCFLARRSSGFPLSARCRVRYRRFVPGVRNFQPDEEKLEASRSKTQAVRSRLPVRRRNTLRQKVGPAKVERAIPDAYVNKLHGYGEKAQLVSTETRDFIPKSGLASKNELHFNDSAENITPESVANALASPGSTNSELWERLDSWVNQYKDDADFWGIGSGPIFTIHQGIDGKIKHVLVNEGEIIKRSRIPVLAREESIGLDRKLLLAKSIAKEIENGVRVMPKNSTIAKFIIDGEKASVANTVKTAAMKNSNLALKGAPWIGLALFCGACVLWVTTKLVDARSTALESPSLSKEEIEMLRRKKISRKRQDESVKGNVLVIQSPVESGSSSLKPPRIDQSELFTKIQQAGDLQENMAAKNNRLSSIDNLDPNSADIQEIRRMVREIRKTERASAEQDEEKVAREDHEQEEAKSERKDENGFVNNIASKISLPAQGTKDKVDAFSDNPLHDPNGRDIRVGSDELDVNRQVPSIVTGTRAIPNSDVTKTSNQKTRKKPRPHEENTVLRGSNSQLHKQLSTVSSQKGKTQIIRSVEEAREYLVKKGVDASGSIARPRHIGKAHRANRMQSVDEVGSSETAKRSFKGDENVSSPSKKNDYNGSFMSSKIRENSDGPLRSAALNLPSQTNIRSFQNAIRRDNVNSALDNEIANASNGEFSVIDSPASSFSEKQHLQLRCAGSEPDDTSVNSSNYQEKVPSVTSTVDLGSGAIEPLSAQCKSSESTAFTKKHGFSVLEENQEIIDAPSRADVSNEHGQHKSDNVSSGSSGDFSDLSEYSTEKATHLSENGTEKVPLKEKEKNPRPCWIERNFQEFYPVFEKIGDGFRENYEVAKVKARELSLDDVRGLIKGINEREWMDDVNLRNIVLRVRDNELAGREPFYMMDAKDKDAFFDGLKSHAEKVNEKLLPLHEYIHSRVENLDYGADAISVNDPLEKIIPRWKGPPVDRLPANIAGKQGKVRGNADSADGSLIAPSSSKEGNIKQHVSELSKKTNTLIECSDGSVRAGRKGGKEHWQHTKKWSQDFLEVYNAETDPEVKSVMKSMGADLDRWLTEKDKKDATDYIRGGISKRRRKYIETKMEKIKREVERYGTQAVVSKYREYTDDNQEDCLWWLDLPYILCLEMYRVEEDVPKVGFYSLEMASELELDPKQYHVIAFEDPGDSKNYCYIVQAHMDMLGDGKAFVVPRPPKDVFREARANGFSVTVVRKGEINLNVDQTLEEVEDAVVEVGSKMYHDEFMRQRSVDAGTLMKGVLLAERHSRR